MLNINFQPFPTLGNETIVLREIKHTDAAELYMMRSNDEVMQYIDRPRASNIDDAHNLIALYNANLQKNEGINWGISLKDSPQMIGLICLWKIQPDNHRAEVGYMLSPAYHRKGIMQQALKTVLDYGFTQINLHSIEATVNPLNTASIALLEKTGFVREAYFKEDYFFNGVFLDTAIYSLINPGHR